MKELLKDYKGYVKWVANRLNRITPKLDFEDIEAIANFELVKAYKVYDKNKNKNLSTHLRTRTYLRTVSEVRQIAGYRDSKRKRRKIEDYNPIMYEFNDDAQITFESEDDIIDLIDKKRQYKDLISKVDLFFSEQDFEIFIQFFIKEKSLADIARNLKITSATILNRRDRLLKFMKLAKNKSVNDLMFSPITATDLQ